MANSECMQSQRILLLGRMRAKSMHLCASVAKRPHVIVDVLIQVFHFKQSAEEAEEKK